MKKRNYVLLLLVLIGIITFLDRINISVAGVSIMQDLNLNEQQWGWTLSAFILSYGLFQVPLGWWGDNAGQRKVLSVIVIWWSLFTIFTGMAGGFASLIIIRFMFGIGEAGAYPCMTGTIGRWFPKKETAKAQGFIWAASRVGGALTPFIVIPVIIGLGWRTAFYILGSLGFIWVAVWYFWYRDNPAKMKGIAKEELREIDIIPFETEKAKTPWKEILSKRQFWILLAMYWFYAWGSWFFFSWFPTFMEAGRGFAKSELTYAVAAPFFMSMLGNIFGGYLSDRFSVKYGLKTGRRILGVGALLASSVFMFLAGFIPGKLQVFIFLSLCFGVIDLMLPGAWAICIDMGKKFGGTVSAAMNTAGNLGGFVCAIVFGSLVKSTGDYNLPLFVISAMLLISALLFSRIDASKPLVNS
ncbi:MFS transporter [Saccharicrinis sp. FJH54]|uniref:MFS transporter n=1 Tax=Saccharicrinis sp. FJH54 TaxID=3344665 RepID=UPI0035D3F95D